jgi:hypothetical protein
MVTEAPAAPDSFLEGARKLFCASPAVHQARSAASAVIDPIAEKPFYILSRR